MVVQAGAAQQVLRGNPDQADQALTGIQATGRAAVDDLRRMLGLLRGAEGSRALAPQPGLGALDELVACAREAGTPIEVERGAVPTLSAGVDLAAYRIIQEAVTNAAKHAHGCPTSIRVDGDSSRLLIEVRTSSPPRRNGADTNGTGHGLIGMRERVDVYGGELEVGFDGHDDWVVRARLPLESP
jgi:signal transduction histidine kinase